MSGKYAVQTSVPVSRTRMELQRTIQDRYHATRYGVLEDDNGEIHIVFTMRDRNIRLDLVLPKRQRRQSQKQFDQAMRSTWRAMLLYVKAKLEACERDVVAFDKEWLPHFLMGSGHTLYEAAQNHTLPFATGPLMLTAGSEVVDAEVV